MKRIHPLQLWHSMIRYKKPNQIKDQLQLTLLYLFKVAKLGSELAALRSERVDSVMEGKSNVLPILVKILMVPPPASTQHLSCLIGTREEGDGRNLHEGTEGPAGSNLLGIRQGNRETETTREATESRDRPVVRTGRESSKRS